MIIDDPICIVGMACRLPGGINSPSNLWDYLINNRSAQGPVPKNRFNAEGFCDSDGSQAGVMNAAGGYFITEDVRRFDNSFFQINNMEATFMDPQQRNLLEVVYECFEHSGSSLERMSGTNTGVYVGSFTVDHQTMHMRDPDFIQRYTATGIGTTILANRISHVFNLQGPSFTLDTACSSTMYCLHNAVNAISSGDCDGAIVAGVNLIMAPEQCLGTAKAGVLSPTSTCHTFDASADGYGRADGINAVYLKKFSEASKNGDKIWAVVRGTAVNANGRTPGITQPSADLQEVVIRKAYAKANLEFAGTDYVECHGTGTPVGDPIEVDAVSRCFSSDRNSPLLIGSSKPNLGHSEAASGLTAMIKVVLTLEHRQIPPTHGVNTVNPELQLEARNLKVVTSIHEWPRPLMRASVNAFGYGGANAHVVLESLDSYMQSTAHSHMRVATMTGPQISISGTINMNGANMVETVNDSPEGLTANTTAKDVVRRRSSIKHTGGLLVVPVSAASATALRTRIDQITKVVQQSDAETLTSVVHTLADRSSHLSHRQALLAKSAPAGLSHIIEDVDIPQTPSSVVSCKPGDVGFVFSGQGGQYVNMAKGLLCKHKGFLKTIRSLDDVLHALPRGQAPQWTLEQTILDAPETSQVNHVTRSQPLCTAIQIALVDLLAGWGILPSGGTVGHSSGEIAAAYASRLLTATQAMLVAYFRGYAVGNLRTEGGMLAAALSAKEADKLLQEMDLANEVCVGCVNAPESVTFSGSTRGIDALLAEIQNVRGKFARKLQTGSQAYHSSMMRSVGGLYESLISPYFPQNAPGDLQVSEEQGGQIRNPGPVGRMFSSVGYHGDDPPALSPKTEWPKYWRQNLERSVQFHSSLKRLIASNSKLHLIEIGPHTTLKGPIEQIRASVSRDKQDFIYSNTLVRHGDDDISLKRLAAVLYAHGHVLQWRNVNLVSHLKSGQLIAHYPGIPTYPWDYSTGILWKEPRMSVELRNRRYKRHALLGSQNVAGNGIDWTWRNVISLDELSWMKDHRLEAKVVFPATAYLATAMEALRQIVASDSPHQISHNLSFEFRKVSINAALIIPESKGADDAEVELHTTLSRRQLSTATVSSNWYDFSISSWVAGTTTAHCIGGISLCHNDDYFSDDLTIQQVDGFETWTDMTGWYSTLAHEGLCFGPTFQSLASLKTDNDNIRFEVVGETFLEPLADEGMRVGRLSQCPVHPITMDACLQAAIMSTTRGDAGSLRAFFPVFIENCQVREPWINDSQALGIIHARSRQTGVSTQRMNCALRDTRGMPIVTFREVKMVRMEKLETRPAISRQPCLRVHWKPDIHHLSVDNAGSLRNYVAAFVKKQEDMEADLADDGRLATIGALLDLLGHRNPRLRVLELGRPCDCNSGPWLDLLGQSTEFQRYESWSKGRLDEHGVFRQDDEINGPFDVVLLPERLISQDYWKRAPQALFSLVNSQGAMIAHNNSAARNALNAAHFTTLEVTKHILLAVGTPSLYVETEMEKHENSLRSKDIVIVTPLRSSPHGIARFADGLATHLRESLACKAVKIVSFGEEMSQVQSWKDTVCVSLLEMEHELLATMTQSEMNLVRKITNEVPILVWLTGANMLGDRVNPDLTLSSGLSRALMLEQPSLQFLVLDVGDIDPCEAAALELKAQVTYHNIMKVIGSRHSGHITNDKEFVQKDGLLHISRFCPDFDINALFQRRISPVAGAGCNATIQESKLTSLRPAQLAIGTAGVTDTIHFQQVREPPTALPAGDVDVLVRAVSLNAKDVYALNGRVETKGATTALEFSGVVTAVGSEVIHLKEGDAVVVLAPCHFSTTERVPAWAAHKMLPTEDHTTICTLPVVYATALYALRERGHLRAGESVLIHGGAGAFGLAAIAIARRMGANVFTTAGSAEKRAFLVNTLSIPEDHVFHSRDESFVQGLKAATSGQGVDLVVNSLVGDLMHASWECVAPFGRFVEIGKRELVDAGKLDMHIFLRNATFTAFDLSDLFFHSDKAYHDLLSRLISEVLELYRDGEIHPVPITRFPVTEVIQAYRFFSAKDRVGKVVVSLEDDESRVPAAPAKYLTIFNRDKVYLLVGCLGGLGRSLSRWMLARGARNFVFLGRSGCDKDSARDVVARLRSAGANITVVRGDVCNATHVNTALKACSDTGRPIGGVIQAAMGLHEGVFAHMTSKAWHTGIQPKWAGTLNLHHSLKGLDAALDFFVLMSSVSGSVGTATESNYCSANGFLDAFARWRRTQGKPAVAVGLGMISEVGYLHENSDIEALLLRRGIQPLKESEFLQVMDLALAGDECRSETQEQTWSAHLLTGLEPFGILSLMDRGFDVTHGAMEDSRASVLSAALAAKRNGRNNRRGEVLSEAVHPKAVPEWYKKLPVHSAASFASVTETTSMQTAVLELVTRRFSNLILMPVDQIEDRKPLMRFGMDSMIASEFRSWFWSAFRVDVPFLDLLSPDKTLAGLSEYVAGNLASD